MRWINPQGKEGESLRKSFHALIIQKCPWLPGEGVCNLPRSDSPKGTGQVLSKPLKATSPWPASTVFAFLIKKSLRIHAGRSRSRPLPQTCSDHARQVGVRLVPRRSPRPAEPGTNTAGVHHGPAPRRGAERGGAGRGGTPLRARGPRTRRAPLAPPPRASRSVPLRLSFPARSTAAVGSRVAPATLRPGASPPGTPRAWPGARRAGRPRPPRGPVGRGPRGGAAAPGPGPAPAADGGARRAPRPRWPRYCFTFPGVGFSLSGKKSDGGRREPGRPSPRPGRARRAPDRPGEGPGPDPRAQPAPGRRRRRPAPGSAARAARAARAPDLTAASPRARPTVCPSVGRGARLGGRTASSLSSRYGTSRARGPSRVPAPSSPGRSTQAGPARGGGGGLGERHRPRARPSPPPPGTRGGARGAGRRARWRGPVPGRGRAGGGLARTRGALAGALRCRTCGWRGPPIDLDAASVRAGSPES